MATPTLSGRVRFGVFEVDLRSGELRKQGIKIKLHDQPFEVLAMLLGHPGEVITREELRQKLWPADTFVDFDVGLNSAVKKLRDALGDSADAPRYVETLPRRGYRLVAPVEDLGTGIVPAPQERADRTPAQREDHASERAAAVLNPLPQPGGLKPRIPWPWRKAGIAVAALTVLAAASWLVPTAHAKPLHDCRSSVQEPEFRARQRLFQRWPHG